MLAYLRFSDIDTLKDFYRGVPIRSTDESEIELNREYMPIDKCNPFFNSSFFHFFSGN